MSLFNFTVHQIKMDPIIPNPRRHLLKGFASFVWNGWLEWKSNLMRPLTFSYGCTPYYIKQFEFSKALASQRDKHILIAVIIPVWVKLSQEGLEDCAACSRLLMSIRQPCGNPQEAAPWGWRRSLGYEQHCRHPWFPSPVLTSGTKTPEHNFSSLPAVYGWVLGSSPPHLLWLE